MGDRAGIPVYHEGDDGVGEVKTGIDNRSGAAGIEKDVIFGRRRGAGIPVVAGRPIGIPAISCPCRGRIPIGAITLFIDLIATISTGSILFESLTLTQSRVPRAARVYLPLNAILA